MAKKARKTSKAKRAKRAKPQARVKVKSKKAAQRGHKRRGRKAPPAKVANAFQIMIDTINETERMRAKAEPHDSD